MTTNKTNKKEVYSKFRFERYVKYVYGGRTTYYKVSEMYTFFLINSKFKINPLLFSRIYIRKNEEMEYFLLSPDIHLFNIFYYCIDLSCDRSSCQFVPRHLKSEKKLFFCKYELHLAGWIKGLINS